MHVLKAVLSSDGSSLMSNILQNSRLVGLILLDSFMYGIPGYLHDQYNHWSICWNVLFVLMLFFCNLTSIIYGFQENVSKLNLKIFYWTQGSILITRIGQDINLIIFYLNIQCDVLAFVCLKMIVSMDMLASCFFYSLYMNHINLILYFYNCFVLYPCFTDLSLQCIYLVWLWSASSCPRHSHLTSWHYTYICDTVILLLLLVLVSLICFRLVRSAEKHLQQPCVLHVVWECSSNLLLKLS